MMLREGMRFPWFKTGDLVNKEMGRGVMIQYSSTGLRWGAVAARVAEEVMVHNTVARVPV